MVPWAGERKISHFFLHGFLPESCRLLPRAKEDGKNTGSFGLGMSRMAEEKVPESIIS